MENPENQTPQVSSAADFKKQREAREKGDILTLQSGLTVRLKRPDVTQIIAKGLIPANMVQRFMNLQGKDETAVKAEDIEAVMIFQRAVAKYALMQPTVVDEPDYDQDQISIDDLESGDLDEIWAYVNGGISAVELFREKRTSGVSARPNSEAVSE